MGRSWIRWCAFLVILLGSLAARDRRLAAAQNAGTAATRFDGITRNSSLPGMREAYLPTIFASSHAANLVALANGDLLCFWFSGTWEGNSDVGIVMSRLAKGTSRWTKPMLIDHHAGESFQNPVPFQPAPGHLWLVHTAQAAGEGQANSRVLWVKSADDGLTWTAPKPLFLKPGSFVRQPFVIMRKGEWMLPMYYTPSRGITQGAESNYSAIEITKDGGRSWKECVIPKSDGLVQPSVVRLGNGSYLAFLRSRFADFIYRSTSQDGCDWTKPIATVLPNNNSSIQAVKLSDGHLVIAFNNVSSTTVRGKPRAGPRKPLSVALSVDGGRTWPWVRDIEEGRPGIGEQGHLPDAPGREEYSYPSVIGTRNGQIYVAFTYRRETIKVVTFDESWIKRGTTDGQYRGLH